MSKQTVQRGIVWGLGILAAWLGLRYLLPLVSPFLLGMLIAFAAEPAVARLEKGSRLKRGAASALGVSLMLLLLLGVLWLVGAVAVRQLSAVRGILPGTVQAVQEGLQLMQDKLLQLAHKAPERLRPSVERMVLEGFGNGNALLGQVGQKLPGALAGAVGKVSHTLLTVGTALLSAFMLSQRLPRLRALLRQRLPERWSSQYVPALKGMKHTLWEWVKAQGKLMGITFLILSASFLLLRIPNALLWSSLIALIDAVPVLGTGTVLLPWAVVSLLQGKTVAGIGLALTYGAAWVMRAVLEPKLVGKHIGLDPLVTLAAFYVGFRLWGVAGMLLAPLAAAAIKGAIPFTNNLKKTS